MKLKNAVIVDAVRSANARGGRGMLVHKRPDDLTAELIEALLKRNPRIDPYMIEDVRLGAVNQASYLAMNAGKTVAHLAGLPPEVAGSTTNRQCASSMDTFHQVAAMIMVGSLDIAIAAGAEKMGRQLMPPEVAGRVIPYMNPRMAQSNELERRMAPNHDEIFSQKIPQYLLDAVPFMGMPQTAQNVAEMYELSREELDEYAYYSHLKAARAAEEGRFKDEIIPTKTFAPVFDENKKLLEDQKGEEVIFDRDECIRPDTSREALAKLPPLEGMIVSLASPPKEILITAGNSCPTNEGAVAVLLMSEEKAEGLGLEPLTRIKSMAVAGVKGPLMGLGPIPSSKKALTKAGLKSEDIDLVELNEAFASQSIACIRDTNLNSEAVNVNGGAIALGHPLGNSGCRLLTTLSHELKRRENVKYGLATMCCGDGQGAATIIERV